MYCSGHPSSCFHPCSHPLPRPSGCTHSPAETRLRLCFSRFLLDLQRSSASDETTELVHRRVRRRVAKQQAVRLLESSGWGCEQNVFSVHAKNSSDPASLVSPCSWTWTHHSRILIGIHKLTMSAEKSRSYSQIWLPVLWDTQMISFSPSWADLHPVRHSGRQKSLFFCSPSPP